MSGGENTVISTGMCVNTLTMSSKTVLKCQNSLKSSVFAK